jgi:hypothetical protein
VAVALSFFPGFLFISFDYETSLISLNFCSRQLRRVAEFRKEHAQLVKGLLPEQEKEAFLSGNIANILKDKDHLGKRITRKISRRSLKKSFF